MIVTVSILNGSLEHIIRASSVNEAMAKLENFRHDPVSAADAIVKHNVLKNKNGDPDNYEELVPGGSSSSKLACVACCDTGKLRDGFLCNCETGKRLHAAETCHSCHDTGKFYDDNGPGVYIACNCPAGDRRRERGW